MPRAATSLPASAPLVDPDADLLPDSFDDRLRGGAHDHDRRRLQTRFAGLPITPIGEAPARRPVRIGGEIRSQHRSAPDDRRFLRVELHDGTGVAVLMFTGRNRIRGIETGRAMIVDGVGRIDNGKLVVWNPAYTLLG